MSDIAFGDVPVLLRQILAKLDGIDTKLTSIEHKQDSFQEQIEALNDRFDAMQEQIDLRFKNFGSASSGGGPSGLARAATRHDDS